MCSAVLWDRPIFIPFTSEKKDIQINLPRIIELIITSPEIPLQLSWPQSPCNFCCSVLPPHSAGFLTKPWPLDLASLASPFALFASGLCCFPSDWTQGHVHMMVVYKFHLHISDFILKTFLDQRLHSHLWMLLTDPSFLLPLLSFPLLIFQVLSKNWKILRLASLW